MSAHTDETTKPSRINRKRKRRWRASTIADLLKSGLTDCYRVAILFPLSQKTKAGIGLSELRRINAALCGFFMRNASPYLYDRVSGAVARLAGPKSGRPTLLILSPWIGLFGGRFKTCYLGSRS